MSLIVLLSIFRTSDVIASGIQWSVRPHFHNERKSAINSIGNEQLLSKYLSTNATNPVFNNNHLSSMQNSTTEIDDHNKNKRFVLMLIVNMFFF